jgi:acyl-CoA synthetase (AMP-forming)/AMP-acid ligase II/thioesterase domain-containing protein/acyl carrier protein
VQQQAHDSSVHPGATIGALLRKGHADGIALSAPNRPHLTYGGLRKQVEYAASALNGLGVGRDDRVAIVLPNGPELACAFVAVASGAAAAPLNPAYRQDDFSFYLSDLGAKALIVERDSSSPAVAAANALHIPVFALDRRLDEPAGTFSLAGTPIGPPRSDGPAADNDIALVLHTSGTTSRPKMVPLSQANLAASARHIVETLALTHEDRCLSVMPLFHIHGLVAGVLSPLAAGGSAFCMPGFDTQEVLFWMAEARPTWYTAVPTMHQAILARAREHPRTCERVRLRFIRSSSAALPPAVMHELERTFKAPVIESYGMTEAAHQMASNPLPPKARKPGSVGLAAGPEIAIMDGSGKLLAAGATGEVVIRGPNVTRGYENNPQANAAAFANGWFRTGDQGLLDEAGYLTITGRLKEIINRGGQKISPREIDDALMEHPAVSSAATFPMPHPTLGEEIGAAVVVRQGANVTEQALANFLLGRLPDFKIPRRLVLVDSIPKGPTGKIQRHDLARALGLDGSVKPQRVMAQANERPPTPLEARLGELWQQTLGLIGTIGLHEEFFALGGDSLQAVELLSLIEGKLGHSLPQSVFLEHGTIARMAEYMERQGPSPCVIPIQRKGTRPPFFCVSHLQGEVLVFRNLARRLGDDQPFYGIQAVGVDGRQAPLTRIEDMAAHFIREIRTHQPAGPYYLGGYSFGGIVAYEMTRQLKAQGEDVAILALLDAYCGPPRMRFVPSEWLRRRWMEVARLRSGEVRGYLVETLREVRRRVSSLLIRARQEAKWRLMRILGRKGIKVVRAQPLTDANAMAVWNYEMSSCRCNAVLFKAELNTWQDPAMHERWGELIGDSLAVRKISGGHFNFMNEPHVQMLATALAESLEHSRSRCGAKCDAQGKAPVRTA